MCKSVIYVSVLVCESVVCVFVFVCATLCLVKNAQRVKAAHRLMRFAKGCVCKCVCMSACLCVCVCVWHSIIIIVLTKEHTQVSYEMQFHFCALYVNMLYVNLCVRLCQTLCPGFTGVSPRPLTPPLSHLFLSLPLSLSLSPCLFLYAPVDCRMRGHCPLAWYRLQPLSLAFSLCLSFSLSISLFLSRILLLAAVKVSKVLEISAGFTR